MIIYNVNSFKVPWSEEAYSLPFEIWVPDHPLTISAAQKQHILSVKQGK